MLKHVHGYVEYVFLSILSTSLIYSVTWRHFSIGFILFLYMALAKETEQLSLARRNVVEFI